MSSMIDLYDAGLFDLDGCLMHGSLPIPHAAEAVDEARAHGWHIGFVTNNASRTPDQVISHLATVGVTGTPDEVVTSPQAAAALLAAQLHPGATVLVVGGPSLVAEVRQAGLVPVDSHLDHPDAVVQGWYPELTWHDLAEAMLSIDAGAVWMATNIDPSLPLEDGPTPGNGSMVHAITWASGHVPQVAGKPEPGLYQASIAKNGAKRPVAIGDRLDTDVEGGNRAGIASALTLTGVMTARDALFADPIRRPNHVVLHLGELSEDLGDIETDGRYATWTPPHGSGAAGHTLRLEGDDIVVPDAADDIRGARTALALVTAGFPENAFTGAVRREDGADAFTALS